MRPRRVRDWFGCIFLGYRSSCSGRWPHSGGRVLVVCTCYWGEHNFHGSNSKLEVTAGVAAAGIRYPAAGNRCSAVVGNQSFVAVGTVLGRRVLLLCFFLLLCSFLHLCPDMPGTAADSAAGKGSVAGKGTVAGTVVAAAGRGETGREFVDGRVAAGKLGEADSAAGVGGLLACLLLVFGLPLLRGRLRTLVLGCS